MRGRAIHRRFVLILIVVLIGTLRCGSGGDGPGVNLGIEGASCTKTPDCETPLQCIQLVCTRIHDSDTIEPLPSDTSLDTIFGEIPNGGDAAVDLTGESKDTLFSWDTISARDTESPEDTIFNPEDIVYPETFVPPDVYTECEGLEVFPVWSGAFEGMIMFNIALSIPGVPQQGVLLVYGDLEFEIKCLEEKLIVLGTIEGVGEAEGEAGLFPYTANIGGLYNPITKTVEAQMSDGVVVMYGLLQVYFEGSFNGSLVDEYHFSGVFDGEETGNNLGIEADASGQGTWTAEPVL